MVSATATRRVSTTAPSTAPQPRDIEKAFLSKWLKVWVGLLCVVTLVVVAYLTLITNSLADINGNLGTVSREVAGAGASTADLPGHVSQINGTLGGIDAAVAPVPGQAGEIITALTSANSTLGQTDASLQDTAGVLQAVQGSAGNIANVLADADEPADNLGVQDIHQRVALANGVNSAGVGSATAGGTPGDFGPAPGLAQVQGDSGAIVGGLDSVNGSLAGVCGSLVVSLLTLLSGGC